jgi:WD40 repeat protein
VWNVGTGGEAVRLPHPLPPDELVFTGDGRRLATRPGEQGTEPGAVRLWDIATGREVGRVTPPQGVTELALVPDGKRLATVGRDHVLRLWDVARSREIWTVPDVDAVVLSRDSARVIGWRDRTARILEMLSGRETGRVTHDGRIDTALLTADSKWLITAGQDRTARISDARNGKEKLRLDHALPVGALALSADGRWLATGSGHALTGPGEARVWELAAGREVARLPHERGVSVVAFSPDGRWVATRSREWPTRLWVWRPSDMVAEACARLTRNLTRDEWRKLVGEADYQATCPNLPVPVQERR